MPEVVGRYTLVTRLATGGMAEVFLATQAGVGGFERQVVLKRILPSRADDPDFVKMFLDEARMASHLAHPNVVQVFDAGEADGTYFIAMEYLRGKDLAAVLKRCEETKQLPPPELTARVLADAARGLHYAHTRTDADGQPMHIVHRDVSPANLFLTFDGATRVLDFGIATAARRTSKTDAGLVKGKFSYMSPEQLEGQPLDGRSDLFALGVVGWELCTAKRLFHRPSDAEVLRAVLECKVPRPSSVTPSCPAGLEAVVLKALSPAPAGRYDDCEAFARALDAFLDEARLPQSPSRLGGWLKQLFPEGDAPPKAEAKAKPALPPPTKNERAQGVAPPAAAPPGAPLAGQDDFLAQVQAFLGTRPEVRKSNVIPPGGPFVGRQVDVAALKGLFDAGARLVTVVAFGGTGKTRLALRLLELERERWAPDGGTWFCDLVDARTAEDVCKAVARALSVDVPMADSDDDTVTHAGRSLNNLGRALVVLDNFEQVAAVAEKTVGRWLTLAPEVRFLVTSREALRLDGERVHPLAPLAVPLAAGDVGASEAVQLFLARAAQVSPAPVSSREDLAAVADIVRRLDGNPLAIELAAAHLGALRPRDVLERLAARFELLGGREGGPKGRHATLWNAIDWSWQLLTAGEQAALSQLSVFRGGFTLEAAQGVVALGGGASPEAAMQGLYRKSLLRHFVAPEEPRELRLSMYESIQDFAAAKLEASGGVGAARARHAGWYLAHGETWARDSLGPDALVHLNRLEAERDNLLEVYERALATLPPTPESARNALRALHVLEPLLRRKGPFASHLAVLDSALEMARSSGVEPMYVARGLRERGNLLRTRGRLLEAEETLCRALEVAQQTADRRLESRVRCDLGVASFVTGDLPAARDGLEAALAAAREVGDDALVVRALSFLGILHVAARELPQAQARCDEALPLARALVDKVSEARVLGTLGAHYLESSKLDLSNAYYAAAVDCCREVGERRLEGYFLGKLAWVMAEQGNLVRARRVLTDAATLLSEVGDLRHEGLFLGYLASLEALERHFDEARSCLGMARVRLTSVRDPLFLAALDLRAMHVELTAGAASAAEAQALLDDVRAARGTRPARVFQSEEVRVAARLLERSLPSSPAAR